MRAKFERIFVPMAERLIAPDQRPHVTFDAFFQNVMFHEVAHGLGIKHTLDGKGTVRAALKEQADPLEEGKADILGLNLIARLHERGQLGEGDLAANFASFLVGILHKALRGPTGAYGQASLAQFQFFTERGAITRDAATGTYRVNASELLAAVTALARKLLMLQGDGDYDGAIAYHLTAQAGYAMLRPDLDWIAASDIPIDVTFRQGMDVLAGVQET